MVQTGIELQDQFSSVILDFASGMMAATNAAVNFQNTMNQNINTSGLNSVQNEIQSVIDDMNALNQTASVPVSPTVSVNAEDIDVPDVEIQAVPHVTEQPEIDVPDSLEVPVTPVVTEQPQIDIPDVGIQQFNTQIEQTQNLLQRVSGIQQIINTESQNMGVLPDDVQGRIQGVNERLLQMKQAMNQISQNPFDMPTEAVEAELASLQSRIRQTVQEQLELNETLSNMDIEVEQPPPVQIPVEWQTDNLDIFTSSGVDRFRQEVQSANNMLEQLSGMQNEIARQAFNTNILPPSAFRDMNALATRIDGVRERIQQIENNPLNMGTDRANEELERLLSQLSQAVQQQNEMNSAIDRMDVQGANTAYLQLSQTIGNTESYIRDNVNEQGVFNETINEGTENANGLMRAVKGAVAAYLTVNTVKEAFNASDELIQTTSRLNMMNDGLQTTEDLVNMAYVAAQDARGEFGAMAGTIARFGNNARDAFSSSAEVVQFAGLVQKQMTIAGASTQEASNAMLQLSQALGSGVLRGDELNSIFEQAPNLIQNIADYLNVPIGKIREMAADGELSAGIVKQAIFAATDEINANFESMPMTWGQIWTSMQNTATMAFQPVLTRLNEIANSDQFQVLATNVINAMAFVAGVVLQIFDLVGAVGQFMADNWGIISPVIYGVAAALIFYHGWQLLCAAANGIVTIAQWAWNAALLACPVTWIIIAIAALIGLVIALANHFSGAGHTAKTAFGAICGAVNVANKFLENLGLTVANIALGIWNAIGALCNNMIVAFHNSITSIQTFWYTLLATVLTVIAKICEQLNKLPFIEFDYSGVVGQADSYAAKAAAAANSKEDYISVGDAFNKGMNTFDTWKEGWIDKAYKEGAEFGDNVSDTVSKAVKGIMPDIPTPGDYPNAIASSNDTARNIADSKHGEKISKNTGDTAKAAQKAAQSLDVTGENLKYIKDMAEREYINRFTTARINVKQTNHNTVNSNMDLDGINEYLRSDLEQRMAATAEGVH